MIIITEKDMKKNKIEKIVSPSSYSKAWSIISTCMEQNLWNQDN